MCFDADSHPPIAPMEGAAVELQHLELTAADGNVFAALRAVPPKQRGVGIIVLPDYHGLTSYYEELALRFAEVGVDAVAIDYYGRTAEAPARDPSFDHLAHVARTTWAGLQADVAAAVTELRATAGVSSLFSIGFCFGGRTSFLLGTLPELGMAGVIGFYGWPVGPSRNDAPAPADVTDRMGAPVLGVFGGADAKIPAEDVAAFEGALTSASVEHRLVTYAEAPHSFFDRGQDEFAAASAEAWSEVRAFVEANKGPRTLEAFEPDGAAV